MEEEKLDLSAVLGTALPIISYYVDLFIYFINLIASYAGIDVGQLVKPVAPGEGE